jgi:chemotaxis family two-component system sensor kinase Cph1
MQSFLCYSKRHMASSEAALILRQSAAQDERLQKFTSTTVHHLLEPVRMVQVYTEILQSASAGRLDGEALQAVEFLQKTALQMQKLLDGLAELVAATAKPSRLQSTVRLDLPLRQALLYLDPELKSAGAKVSYGDLPAVSGDFDRLQLVFQHLIRNAVQYRGEPAPEIVISARRTDKEWVLTVHDNGPGIPPEFHGRIFELYTRLHGKSLPGNGLGLPICRTIIETHGGSIWLESGPGQGSAFFFTLPAQS